MHRYYCTCFDRNYLVRGLALHASLLAHESVKFTIFVVCLDELTRLILEKLALQGVVCVPLNLPEQADPALQKARHNRSVVEYYWTLTPTIISYIMKNYREADIVTYLDSDLFFFSDPGPIFEEFAGRHVMIHEHRFHKGLEGLLEYGRFNVGLLSFRRSPEGLGVLDCWRQQCNEWCYARLEDGKYGDQLYLDEWPERFEGVHLLQHKGVGVAPWNNLNYEYGSDSEGRTTVDGFPLIFYHFHALHFVHPKCVVLSKIPAHRLSIALVLCCYLPYVRSLGDAVKRVREILPEFSCGIYGDMIVDTAAIIEDADRVDYVTPDKGLVSPEMVKLDDRFALLLSPQLVNSI